MPQATPMAQAQYFPFLPRIMAEKDAPAAKNFVSLFQDPVHVFPFLMPSPPFVVPSFSVHDTDVTLSLLLCAVFSSCSSSVSQSGT